MLRFWSGHSCDSRGLTKSSRNHCHWGRGIVTRLISRYVWSTARSETSQLSRITINNYGSHLHEYSEWCHGKNFPPSVNLLIPKLYFYLLHSPTQTFNYFLSSRNFTKFQYKNEWLAVSVSRTGQARPKMTRKMRTIIEILTPHVQHYEFFLQNFWAYDSRHDSICGKV